MRSYIKGSPCQGQEISALMLLFPLFVASMKLFAFSLFMSIAFYLGTRSGLHAHQASVLPPSFSSSIIPIHMPISWLLVPVAKIHIHSTLPGGLYRFSKIRLPWRSEPFRGSGEWKCIPAVENPDHGMVWWQLSLHVSLVAGENSSTSVIPLWFVHWLLKRVKVAIFW